MFLLAFFFALTIARLSSSSPRPAVGLQLPSQQIFPFDNSSSFPLYTPSSNTTSTNSLTSDEPRCLGARYGYDLPRSSCLDAWRSIPTDDEQHTFGSRSGGTFEYQLPYRFPSRDGLCAIDVIDTRGGEVWDYSSWAGVSKRAKELLDYCVLYPPSSRKTTLPVGGVIGGVGTSGELGVTLRSYHPDVTCRTYPPYDDGGRCLTLLGILPISQKSFVFSRTGRPGDRKVTVPDGKEYTEPKRICTARIDLEDEEDDTASYLDLWAGAVAVDRMCVNEGKAGMSFGLGYNGRLTVELGP